MPLLRGFVIGLPIGIISAYLYPKITAKKMAIRQRRTLVQIEAIKELMAKIPGEPCGGGPAGNGIGGTCTNPRHMEYWELLKQIRNLEEQLSHRTNSRTNQMID